VRPIAHDARSRCSRIGSSATAALLEGVMLNHARHEKRAKTLRNLMTLALLWQKRSATFDRELKGSPGNFAP